MTIALATAAIFATRCYLAFRPLAAVDGLGIPDDGYLVLEIARNIAIGAGPRIGGVLTNGFQPLYTYLIAPIFWAFGDDRVGPVHWAQVVSVAFDAATFALLMGTFRRVRGFPLLVALGACYWGLNGTLTGNTLNAMETSTALFFLLLLYLQVPRVSAASGRFIPEALSPRRALLLGLTMGFGVLARVDLAIFSALIGAWIALGAALRARASGGFGRAFLDVAITAAAALVVLVPWYAYSYAITGHAFPISGEAVRMLSLGSNRSPTMEDLQRMAFFARGVLTDKYLSLVALPLGVVLVAGLTRPNSRAFLLAQWRQPNVLLLALFIAAILCAYAGVFFGPWFFVRYFNPVHLLLALLLLQLAASVLETATAWAWRVPVLAAIALVIAFEARDPTLTNFFLSQSSNNLGYMNLGLWADRNFPAGTVVACEQSGALTYWAPKLKVVNLDGVVSGPAFDAIKRKDVMGYVKQQKADYVLGWSINLQSSLRNSPPGSAAALKQVGEIKDFRSWGHVWEIYQVAR